MSLFKPGLIICPHCGNHTRRHPVHYADDSLSATKRLLKKVKSAVCSHHVASHVCEHCNNLLKLSPVSIPLAYYLWFVILLAVCGSLTVIAFLLIAGT